MACGTKLMMLFEGIIFGSRHLLHSRGVDDDFDAFERSAQSRFVTNVADEIALRLGWSDGDRR